MSIEDALRDDPVHGWEARRYGGWKWDKPRHGEHFRRCSYCGSVNPEDLSAEPEWHADWADMKYGWPHKFYVNIPNRHPDAQFVIASTVSEEPPGRLGSGSWVRLEELTKAQRKVAKRDGYMRNRDEDDPATNWLMFGTREHHFGKFYTAHLADPLIDADVRAVIEKISGLHFTFPGNGKVRWEPYRDVSD